MPLFEMTPEALLEVPSTSDALPRSRFLPVDGTLTGENLAHAFVATYAASSKRLGRWFLEAPLHDNGRTWVLSKCGAPTQSRFWTAC